MLTLDYWGLFPKETRFSSEMIRLLGSSKEKVRRLKAEELVDDSIVKKLEKENKL